MNQSKPLHFLLLTMTFVLISKVSVAQLRQIFKDNNPENYIQNISFYSSNEGYVAFRDHIAFTQDSGHTFTPKPIRVNNVNYNGIPVNLTFGFAINGVKAFDRNNLLVYGHYGFIPAILRSTNGGSNYTLIEHSTSAPNQFNKGFTDMVFPENNDIGYVVDADRILKTTNKGINWATIHVNNGSEYEYLEGVNNSTVFALSTAYLKNKIIRTTNGGLAWNQLVLPAVKEGAISHATFLTASTGWVSILAENSLELIYKTTNGGTNWILMNDPVATPFISYRLKFMNETTGYALQGYTVFKTTDSGKTWEPLARDNDFNILSGRHRNLQIFNSNLLWAGGEHGFLELSNNAGGTPLPTAYFKTDTTGVTSTGTVQLLNYSKTGYTYRWIVNNAQVSTSYNAEYTHDPGRETDTIQLIVSNGQRSDTAVLYQVINPPVIIYDFNPKIAISGTEITITGNNFHTVNSVKFGNVEAAAFYAISNKELRAIVQYAVSGPVTVTTERGTGIKPGFIFYEDPRTDIPVSLSDSILCKSGSVRITIKNTEPLVRYSLTDYDRNIYASVDSKGGTIELITRPITQSGWYILWASRMDIDNEVRFPKPVIIEVEQTQSNFGSEYVNLLPGEITSFHNRSYQASSFQWIFHEDANIKVSIDAVPKGISYATPGQKTITLISTSSNGCTDTTTGNAVFVYPKPSGSDHCYGLTITDSALSYQTQDFLQLNKVVVAENGDFYLSGSANKPELKSRFGVNKKFNIDNLPFFAKYNSAGVLMWTIHMPGLGNIYGAEKDDQGNLYILGITYKLNHLHFPNGDSLQIGYAGPNHTTHNERINGFILKIDAQGNYIWHSVLENSIINHVTYDLLGGSPTGIKVRSNMIVITGISHSNLTYYHKEKNTTLININDSPFGSTNNTGFALAIDTSGSYLWHSYMENRTSNKMWHTHLSIDKNGNSIIGGPYEDDMKITDAADKIVNLPSIHLHKSSYLIKFDKKGNLLWKSVLVNNQKSNELNVTDLVTDATGNSYFTGSHHPDGNNRSFILIDANDDTTIINRSGLFVGKINPNGQLIWEAGSNRAFSGGGTSIVLQDSSVLITGYLTGNGFEPVPIEISSTDNYAVRQSFDPSVFFILQYDTLGKIKHLNLSGTSEFSRIIPNKIYIDKDKNFLISASNWSTLNTSSYFNINQATKKRDGIFLKLNPILCTSSIVSPTIDAGNNYSLCAGDSVALGSTVDSQSSYYWTSIPAGFTSDKPKPTVKPTTTTKYLLTVTSSNGKIFKDSVTITINKPVTDAGLDTTICEGNQVILGSEAVSGQNYRWESDPVGFSSTSSQPKVQPVTSTRYFLTVTGIGGCQFRDTVMVNVRPVLEPSVSITTDTTNICLGTSVLFNAIANNAGNDPIYQWTINGSNVGANNNTFESAGLRNGDQVALILTSRESCVSKSVVNSNEIRMTVYATPELTISGTTEVAKGQPTVLKLFLKYAETITTGYQWQDSTSVNGWQNINGATDTSLTYTPIQTGDKIRCLLTSDLPCSGGNPIISNSIIFTVKITVGISPVPALAKNMRYYPNPVTSILTIDSIPAIEQWETLELFNISGKRIKNPINISRKQLIKIDLTDQLPGIYVAVLRRKSGNAVYFRFVKL